MLILIYPEQCVYDLGAKDWQLMRFGFRSAYIGVSSRMLVFSTLVDHAQLLQEYFGQALGKGLQSGQMQSNFRQND